MKIGVTAPGSSTNFLVNFAAGAGRVYPNDVSFIGVGSALSAVAAIQNGDIDAICHIEPVMTMLEQNRRHQDRTARTRTEDDTVTLFGGYNSAAVAYLKTTSWTKIR